MTLLNVLCMSCSEIFANSYIQAFSKNQVLQNLVFGILGYAIVLFFLIRSFNHGNMLWVTTMWEGMIIVLSAMYAFFILGERMPHGLSYVGLLLAFAAMCCVQLGEYLGHNSAQG